MVLTHVPIPGNWVISGQKIEQIEALLGARIVIGAVEIAEGVDASVVGEIIGFLAEAIVGQVRAEVVEQSVVGAIGEEIQVEGRGEPSNVDPTAGVVGVGLRMVEIVSEDLGRA
ncbi:xyloglucan galactosyltransferase KATAMARI1-like protein [Pyrus ussuriensis x Pyrus communis]|uniref:Xyloglucan galactosyltransferase KATAMARI1-like protein n=1 Tax=Pyrus ussuriensis x Pyrus communis TaxID=2448454 RepID=A0A5N5HV85_9ROSA|nr:xyloglucan galactosyltransferase KATAMARI1-like protein [Pyrus ussuriensis x Pyrus communis]